MYVLMHINMLTYLCLNAFIINTWGSRMYIYVCVYECVGVAMTSWGHVKNNGQTRANIARQSLCCTGWPVSRVYFSSGDDDLGTNAGYYTTYLRTCMFR